MPLATLRHRRAELVLRSPLIAVFSDCFWHGCPQHRHAAKANAER